MRVIVRVFSIVLGILSALGGLVALGYTLEGIEFLKFFKGKMLGGIVGVVVPGVLSASAFYMAFRFIKSPIKTDTNNPPVEQSSAAKAAGPQ